MQERRTGPIVAAIVAIPLLLFGAYMGAYYAMLTGKDFQPVADDPEGMGLHIEYWPTYRVEFALIDSFFAPAHSLDRIWRPVYWGYDGRTI